LSGTPKLGDYGTFALDNMTVAPDATGNLNIAGAHEVTMALYYVDELATDLWASIDAAIDDTTDPVTAACTVNPDTARTFKVGDFILFNDEAADVNNPGRRSYECARSSGRATSAMWFPPATSSCSGRILAFPRARQPSERFAASISRASASSSSTRRRSRSASRRASFARLGFRRA
jgi:hypothetical protein